jgi:Acetyltransferase (GNAT) domain
MKHSLLDQLGIHLEIGDYDLQKLSEIKDPTVFVSNHLFPGLDESLLHVLLQQVGHELLTIQPSARFFPAAISATMIAPPKTKPRLLCKSFVEQLRSHTQLGHMLGMVLPFSRLGFVHLGNPKYAKEAIELILELGMNCVPVHFVPEKPLILGKLSKTVKLFFEGKQDQMKITALVGNPIQPHDLQQFTKKKEVKQFFQASIFSLGSSVEVRQEWFVPKLQIPDPQMIAAPINTDILKEELSGLQPQYRLFSKSQYDVFCVPSSLIPQAMLEIGRLRELSFRAVGEGTGKGRDIDQYDVYYEQLFIWDRVTAQIVGGYRLGNGELILKKHGFSGFYSHSLFKFKKGFLKILGRSLELGRSFVVTEYQKKPLPLLILWQAILHYLKQQSKLKYIIGPLSITNEYTHLSKSLMIDFLDKYYTDEEYLDLVTPRKPYKVDISIELLTASTNGNVQKLSSLVESMIPSHQGIPILLKQYLKQNARFLAFSRDPLFANCIDGFMMLDIHDLPSNTLDMLHRNTQQTELRSESVATGSVLESPSL